MSRKRCSLGNQFIPVDSSAGISEAMSANFEISPFGLVLNETK